MLQVIIPYVRCVTDQADFQAAIDQGFSEVFVITPSGYFKHQRLSGGRYVRLEVPDLPKEYKNAVEIKAVTEELNFLPAGRIPMEFFHQILYFFKEVMRVKNSQLEAHCFILWSKEQGYYISVPKQVVSKASVSFTYDKDSIPEGSVIVVDYHSHNGMSAFWSGTDNASDANGIYYSGVIGKLDTDTPQNVLRFNLHTIKKMVTLSEIFEDKAKEVEIDPSWLNQIEVRAPVAHGGRSYLDRGPNMGLYGGYPSLWEDFDRDDEKEKFYNQRTGLLELIESQEEAINNDPVGPPRGEDYDFLVSEYGKDAADAVEQIETWMDDLAEEDDLLLPLMGKMFELLSDKGQLKLSCNGF